MTDATGDPNTAFLFPGQGAQHVGMGKDLYESSPAAKRVFELAEDVCGLPLREFCFEGPEGELSRTNVAQPAIFTASAATLAAMDETLPPERMNALRPGFAAGLSLGEYTALYAADAIDLEPALELVTRRGALMQEAATAVPSGMVSVLGLDPSGAEKLCEAARQDQVLVCANFNCPGQVVLSGEIDACKRAEEMAKDFGAAGAVPLKVAGAFHSKLMAPAAAKLAEALKGVIFRPPKTAVLSNVTAQEASDPEQIKQNLLDQLISPVRWQQSMENLLAQDVTSFYEIGPGRVLAGLMRRIHRKTKVTCVNSREAVAALSGE